MQHVTALQAQDMNGIPPDSLQHILIPNRKGRADSNSPASLPYLSVFICQSQTMASLHVPAAYPSTAS